VAGARKVELDCDGSFAEAATRVVALRSREVFERAEGVLDIDDVERVHDMRVATRRLRAALEVFAPAFPRKRHRKALRRVKALADALGARRDADVEIELLECLADPGCNAFSTHDMEYALHPGEREALAALIADVRKRQQRANHALAPYVRPKRLKKLRKRLKRLVKAAGT
jgi:CHAD domain-containing protein